MRYTLLLGWVLGLGLLLGCAPLLEAEDPLPTTILQLPDGRSVTLEIAATPQQRSLGLMFRPRLADNRGMLFLFPHADTHAIWMKNTLIPLDILWLDDHYRIIHLEAAAPPCRSEPCPIYQPPAPAWYVIELAAGAATRSDLRIGAILPVTLNHAAPPPLP
jgi:uncharacterized membrane protein (UPF0127 family)